VASTLIGIIDLASWPPFRRKVQAAMIKAAVAVGAEAAVDGSPRSQLRRALSVNVFAALDDYTQRFAIAVATNPVVDADSPDDAIEFTVNSMWDAIAGAPPASPA
jgi:hypothetical protein